MPSKKNSVVAYTHVMVDLETVGKRAGCGVLSIGAVAFDPVTKTLGPEFYQVVRIADCEALGLHSDPSTIAWWESQSKEAQQVLKQARGTRGTKTLEKSLQSFNMYLAQFGGRRNVKVWGNGSDFDNAILYACYAAVEMEIGWEFWNSRCFRTLKNLSAIKADPRQGTHHNALDDAIFQAGHANKILAVLK